MEMKVAGEVLEEGRLTSYAAYNLVLLLICYMAALEHNPDIAT